MKCKACGKYDPETTDYCDNLCVKASKQGIPPRTVKPYRLRVPVTVPSESVKLETDHTYKWDGLFI